MEPGGGVMLLPLVKFVVSLLLLGTLTAAALDFARIHMVVLSVLAIGLLISLNFFQSEYQKVQRKNAKSSSSSNAATTASNANKTD